MCCAVCEDFVADTDLGGCQSMGLTANLTNGVCYNGTEVYGLWNSTLAEENGIKKVLATEDYLV